MLTQGTSHPIELVLKLYALSLIDTSTAIALAQQPFQLLDIDT